MAGKTKGKSKSKTSPTKKNLDELLKTLSPEKKARVLWAAKQLALLRKNNPARYYIPNGKSEEFIKLVGQNKHFVSLFLAANGVGKTCTGSNMVANICYGPQSKWFQSPLYKDFPYLKQGRIISDPTTLEEKIVPELHKWLPKGKYETSKAGKTYESQWKTNTGFEFDLMSNEQDAKEFESVDLGWCIEENQRVLLSDGRWIKIKDIRPGDEIFTTNDNYRKKNQKVIAVWDKGIKDVVKIKMRGGYELKVTPDHKIWTNKGWKKAGELKTGDRLYSPYFNFNGRNTIENRLAFLLGAWIGDGWMNGSIFISCANEILLNDISNKVQKISHKERYDYRIVDDELRELLVNTGLSDKHAKDKFIPDFIFSESTNQIELLKGLYATDGWFANHTVGYGTTSKRLANDLRFLLDNLGIKAGIYEKKPQNKKWNKQWFVLITQKNNVKRFCELVPVESKTEAQQKVYSEALRRIGKCKCKEFLKKNTRRIVKSIEPVGQAKVYDLSIEGEHSFICNGVRVSNCWFDEPPRWDIFKATVARMRRGGIIFMTLTPLVHSAWIKDELVDKAKEKGVAYVTADVEANCKRHGVRGILEHKDIERMIAQYDEDEKLARIEGKFGHLIGLIFKMFDRNIHVIEPFDINHREFSVYHALDPHPRVEDAGLWLAVDKKGTKYVVDELFIKVDSDRELAFQIKQKNDKYRLESMIADPSMFVTNQHESASLASKLQGHGLYYHEASKLRQAADRRIKDALTFQEVKGHMVRAPELYIFSTCTRTIFEIERYRWDDWRGRSATEKTPKPKPVDKDDHMVENLGRLLLPEPVFVPVVEQGHQTQIINDDPY